MSATAAISGLVGLAQSWLSNDAAEDEHRSAVDLAVVEATGQVGRLLALTYLFGGDVAVAFGLIEPEAFRAYMETMTQATPDWMEAAKQAAVFGMWGASEKGIRRVQKVRGRQRKREREGPAGDQGTAPAPDSLP